MENTQNTKELVSFRMQKSAKKKLADLVEATGRSQTFLAEEAIEQYYDIQQWQIEAIDEGLEAAKDGRFVAYDDIKTKWETKRADLMD